MAESTSKLVLAVEAYFDDLRRIRASGSDTHERSYYPPLTNLLNAVGAGKWAETGHSGRREVGA